MKTRMIRNIPLVIVFLASFLFTQPAQAALSIISISPNVVSNATSTTLTITGSDFQPGAVISIDGIGSLSSSFFSSTTYTAVLPAGLPQGVYTVSIENPDGGSTSLTNALTIQEVLPTSTPEPETGTGYERPVIVIASYTINRESVSPGDDFDLSVKFYNAGQKTATNVVATFVAGELIPRVTGGVVAAGDIEPDHRAGITQPFTLSYDVWSAAVILSMAVTYTDEIGNSYSESFTISIPISHPIYSAATPSATPSATPTATPTQVSRPQLVISDYDTSVATLQPGTQFTLTLTIQNTGTAKAKSISMIIGGGSSSGSYSGTPDPGGVSGSGGEFINFAPLRTSNIQALGDLNPGGTIEAGQSLIVNVSTTPGAYPMKISFVYIDEGNHSYTDDQVVTLLVYLMPVIDINYYQDPGVFFMGQPNIAPVQIVNKGRSTIILGNMKVSCPESDISNNTILIGALEPGGYFTLDPVIIPYQAGSLELLVQVDYTDDFNQPQVLEQALQVEVMDMPVPDGGEGEIPMEDGESVSPDQPETFLQKVWRFFLGLIGLDSGRNIPGESSEILPVEIEESSNIEAPLKMP